MDRILSNLGLAKRSGKIVSGTEMVIEGLRNNTVYLVFLASDTEKNTTKRISDKTTFYEVSLNKNYTSNGLSQAIGGKNVHVIGIMDRGFAKLLKE